MDERFWYCAALLDECLSENDDACWQDYDELCSEEGDEDYLE